jgi:mRNA-degrading endonuclease YafQ of YafQ-DinJ toxin-antitoxin module
MNTTLENNKLIAEFMGAKYNKDTNFHIDKDFLWLPRYGICNYKSLELGVGKTLEFHSNWNWLMQVVEKIDNLKTPITNNHFLIGKFEDYEVHIQGKCIVIYAHGEVTKEVVHLRGSESNTSIEAVYKACVEFIKWYNKKIK